MRPSARSPPRWPTTSAPRSNSATAERQIEDARAAQLDAALRPRTGDDLVARQAYLERTESAHEVSRQVVTRSEAFVETQREELTQAARDRQALERLKVRREAEFVREAARIESNMLDEIAIINFRRRAA